MSGDDEGRQIRRCGQPVDERRQLHDLAQRGSAGPRRLRGHRHGVSGYKARLGS